MAKELDLDTCRLLRSERGRYFFIPKGTPIPAGTLLVQDENGRTEWLKEGTTSLWEIRPDFAHLILQRRARLAGEQAGQLFDTLLRALGATDDDPVAFLGNLAKASSTRSANRTDLKLSLDQALLEEQRPEFKQAIKMLEKELLT